MIAAATTFSVAHIAVTAGLTGLLAVPLAYWLLRPRSWLDIATVALIATASVFLWRKSANMGPLNDDGLSPFSANDWLAPVLSYVSLGVYAALRPPADPKRYSRLRALVTILAFLVNVMAI